ncbi:MAG: hypothetical protein AAGJ83_06265 [Planctomycetota bacterium]
MIARIEWGSPEERGSVNVSQLDGLQELAGLIERANAILQEPTDERMAELKRKNEALSKRLLDQEFLLAELRCTAMPQPTMDSA